VPQELGGIGKKLAAVLVVNKLDIVLKFLLSLFDRKLSFVSLPFCIFLYLIFFGCNHISFVITKVCVIFENFMKKQSNYYCFV